MGRHDQGIALSQRAFERLVRQVMRSLPDHVFEQMSNVIVTVQDEPGLEAEGQDDGGLVALYLGVPQTDRGGGYMMIEPDRIILYQRRIERLAGDRFELRREIKRTLLHEIAHHFGISDDQLHQWARY